MSESLQESSLFRSFECFRVDSTVSGDLFSAPRSHYFSEILLLRSGSCRIVRGNITHTLLPGEMIFIAPFIRHSVNSADGHPFVFDIVKFSAARLPEIPTYLPEIRAFSMDAVHTNLPIHMTADEVRACHLDGIVSECLIESERRQFAWDLQTRALIYLLITGLCRFWLTRRETLTDLLPAEPDPLETVPAYIQQHISEPLRVEDLARRCDLSYPCFARRFRQSFGLSCKQFIEHVRTEAVEQYLIYSDLSLSEISQRTGYTDSSHMVKDFRRLIGTTPGYFRSTLRKQIQAPFPPFSAQTELIHAQRVDTQRKNG